MTVCLRQAVFVPPSVCVVADELGIYADGGDLRIVAQVESTTPLQLVAGLSVTGVQGLRGAVLGVDAVNHGFPVVPRHLLARERRRCVRGRSRRRCSGRPWVSRRRGRASCRRPLWRQRCRTFPGRVSLPAQGC
jgi:hypothetical protein